VIRVVGYVRTSTDEQTAGLDAQESTIRDQVAARGWQLVRIVREQASGAQEDRPGLAEALQLVRGEHADALVVAKLDRLTRSLAHLARLLEEARTERWTLVAIDVGVDLSTPAGELIAGVMGTVSQFERRLIGVRTREALAVKRAQGVRLGGPRRCPDDVLTRVLAMRAAGARLIDIAAALNADSVPTPGGGKRWWPSHVSRLLATQDAKAQVEEG
jgi:DNA invertase Pin-like site-specific DNA recombinase